MWSRSYRKHAIMAFPTFDTVTNSWAPQADISWPTGPVRESEFVRFPIRVMSEAEAVACALNRSKSWIDQRLRHMRSVTTLIQGMEGLQGRLARTDAKTAARVKYASPKTAAVFTFNEFKSAMLGAGVESNEESLRKSYGALMKLRKKAHCSWAEIKLKVERSRRENRTAPKAAKNSATRLPLTERDWRRIV